MFTATQNTQSTAQQHTNNHSEHPSNHTPAEYPRDHIATYLQLLKAPNQVHSNTLTTTRNTLATTPQQNTLGTV